MKGFDKLDIDSKSIVLQYNGRPVTSIIYYNYRTTLYAYKSMLIEEYFDTETKEITRISVASSDDLRKYVEHVDLDTLV